MPCRFFAKGSCTREQCPFLHDPSLEGTGRKPGPPGGYSKMPESTGMQFVGLIKTFNPEKKVGFIDCAETKAQFGCDVFVVGTALNRCSVGDQVIFELGLNDKGQPQAMNVVATGESMALPAMEPPAKRQRVGDLAVETGSADS